MKIYWADFRFPPINLWVMPPLMYDEENKRMADEAYGSAREQVPRPVSTSRIEVIGQNGNTGEHYMRDVKERKFLSDVDVEDTGVVAYHVSTSKWGVDVGFEITNGSSMVGLWDLFDTYAMEQSHVDQTNANMENFRAKVRNIVDACNALLDATEGFQCVLREEEDVESD